MADKKELLERAQAFVDEATSYLLDTVPDGINWEDEHPDVDAARTAVMDMIEALKGE